MKDQPYRFEKTHHAAELQTAYPDLEPGTETGDVVTVAGRLMLRRVPPCVISRG